MMSELGWTPLEERRKKLRLTSFYKIVHGKLHLDLRLNQYATKKITRLRRSHDEQYDVTSRTISTTQLANLFFPNVISNWNNLPKDVVKSKSTDGFKTKLNMPESLQKRIAK